MSHPNAAAAFASATTLHCPQCGGAMQIKPQHMETPVACPHCGGAIEPWRRAGVGGPPPIPQAVRIDPRYRADGYSWRNRWVAGALGVLLGSVGVHRFYLGFTGIGILQAVLIIPTFGLSGIWGFVEGILCFCGAMRDVDGLPLHD